MPLPGDLWNVIRYTVLAPIYDQVAGFSVQRRRSLALLDLRPGESVLLSGAGTGADVVWIPRGVQVEAIDLTPAMVDRIRRRARRLGRPVTARVMDAGRLEYPAGRFDAVVLHLILAVVADPVACLREAARVLKPGGRAVIFDKFLPDDADPSLGRRVLNAVARVAFSDLNRRLGPLLAQTPLRVVHREPAGFGGAYQIILVHKSTR